MSEKSKKNDNRLDSLVQLSKEYNKSVKNNNSKNKPKSTSTKKKSTKSKTMPIKFTPVRLIVFLIIVAITLGAGFVFKGPIEKLLNPNQNSIANAEAKVIDDNGLSIHFIDVGQGDAIAIKFPGNQTMLVDAGTSQSANGLVDYLKNDFFKNEKIVFDYLLLTHSDADHCGGMVEICKEFVINVIYRPRMYSKYTKNGTVVFDETIDKGTNINICETATYYRTINAFNNEIGSNGQKAKIVMTDLLTVNTTDKIEGEGYSIDFYAPTQNYITDSAGTVANDFSPIMVLNYNGKKIMLTGDASTTSESNAMSRAELPEVDLLKVGHHGSKTSSGQDFLNKIKPKYAVISVGVGNTYKHPTDEALNRLLSVGSLIYRTDLNGTIIANITSSESAELNLFANGKPTGVYIHIEYLISGIIVLVATICFSKKIKI
ncbi:MAG TPA: hypothetical protein DCO89_01865 [Clostridiales bacterium]|nr:hypothetical protein [Clostridiales bacterium]